MTETKQGKSEHSSEISTIQIRMARAALGWGTRELASAAEVSGDTVNRVESGHPLRPRTLAAIRQAFEDAGIEFMADNAVRLKQARGAIGRPEKI